MRKESNWERARRKKMQVWKELGWGFSILFFSFWFIYGYLELLIFCNLI